MMAGGQLSGMKTNTDKITFTAAATTKVAIKESNLTFSPLVPIDDHSCSSFGTEDS